MVSPFFTFMCMSEPVFLINPCYFVAHRPRCISSNILVLGRSTDEKPTDTPADHQHLGPGENDGSVLTAVPQNQGIWPFSDRRVRFTFLATRSYPNGLFSLPEWTFLATWDPKLSEWTFLATRRHPSFTLHASYFGQFQYDFWQ